MDDKVEGNDLKRQLKTIPVRSRINADTELWDKITFLKQDCRTSGNECTKKEKIQKKKILTQKKNKNRCHSSFGTKLYKGRNGISLPL